MYRGFTLKEKRMLVLSRRVGEGIVITVPGGGRIRVVVNNAWDGKASIGVEAPREYQIHRDEIQEQVDLKRSGDARAAAARRAP
jgi:carbon storage regulator CsrA